MSPPCPRCGAPLHGPVCGNCGARYEAPPPPPQYPPGYPPPQPGMQGYGYPPPGYPPPGYPPPGAPVYGSPRSSLPVVAGVVSIILFGIYTLLSLLGLIGGIADDSGDEDKGTAIVVVILMLAWNIVGIVMGAKSCKRVWWGALVAGILHTITALVYLISALAAFEAKDRVEKFGGINASEVGTVGNVLLVFFLITAVAAILCYAAIPKAKRDGAPISPHQVAGQF